MIIGVLGGGQLGRMLGMAGAPLGLRFRFLDPDTGAPAADTGTIVKGDFHDDVILERFVQDLDVVTFEFENVPAESMRQVAYHAPVYPPPDALETAQDRLCEKRLFQELDIPTPLFLPIATEYDLEIALAETGTPAILKTRSFGYDGKGQWIIKSASDVPTLWSSLPVGEFRTLILEGFIRFDRELSLIAARGTTGEVCFYPLVENRHEGGILRLSIAPAPGVPQDLQETAQKYMLRILEALDYVGVLTMELFQCGDNLLANEIAPRVHNSGHWTIEGAETSQFENHLRAILGLPLGSTCPRGVSAMWNLLGMPPPLEMVLAVPGAHLHLYGKQPRPGRKIGHITICAPDSGALNDRLAQIQAIAPQS
jgi:5-(carboxyamino)imidazole ribonucleotide synthase